MAHNPPALRPIDPVPLAPEEALHERLRPGERLLYVDRLAPVEPDPSVRRWRDPPIDPSLAAALAELPDRRSKARR